MVPVVFLFLWSCCGLATVLLWVYCGPIVSGCCHAVNLLRSCCCDPVVVPSVGQVWCCCSLLVFLLWFLSLSLRCGFVVRVVVLVWSGYFCVAVPLRFCFFCHALVVALLLSGCGLVVVLLWSCCGLVVVG